VTQTIGDVVDDQRMELILSSALTYAFKHYDDFAQTVGIPEQIRAEVMGQLEQIAYASAISAVQSALATAQLLEGVVSDGQVKDE
jgi:hypothetical protein